MLIPKLYTIETMRHSAAHLLASAIQELYPQAKFGVGPVVENGFYYDLDLPIQLNPKDLSKIEQKMRQIQKRGEQFVRKEMTPDEAMAYFKERGQTYKVELLHDIKAKGTTKVNVEEAYDVDPEAGNTISVYETGKFVDLCRGPHVKSTKEIGPFKLTSLAGAYWRGSEKNKMLQRIYGLCFETEAALESHVQMVEEAEKRDHRRLGKELKLFAFSDYVGPGLPLWLPRGTVLVEELERLAREREFAAGYERVRTPHVAKEIMYTTSGHLPYYAESMFPPMVMKDESGETSYYLKAMNCPHHHQIYAAEPRSYRDLPLRLAEYSTVYRYEKSGELFGLMRARSLGMNDAHIYCTPEQFAAEFQAVNDLYLGYFKLFGLTKYVMRFSTHDPVGLGKKYVNEPALWRETETMVRRVLTDNDVNFVEVADEAAFYGPKIDVQVWSSIGREFTIATNQVDFAQPRRFNLTYIDRDGAPKTPVCIHRAPLGTHERFIGFLIEHYGGAFPLWLSPVQVSVIPVGEHYARSAARLATLLGKAGVRAKLDDANESVGKKVRNAEIFKVPYVLVIGEKEAPRNGKWTDRTKLAVRVRGRKNILRLNLQQFLKRLQRQIQHRKD